MCVRVYVTINVNFHDNTKTRTTQNWKKANINLKTKNINQTNSPHPFVLLSKKKLKFISEGGLEIAFYWFVCSVLQQTQSPFTYKQQQYQNHMSIPVTTKYPPCFVFL